MGKGQYKQFLPLGDRPILCYTLEAFENCDPVDRVVLVVPRDCLEFCRVEVVDRFGFGKVQKVIPGGPRRQDSVLSLIHI